ncbi:putative membrane protein [Streptococcus oralis]|nr:putative membrane protein [Streptococcus oralis]
MLEVKQEYHRIFLLIDILGRVYQVFYFLFALLNICRKRE